MNTSKSPGGKALRRPKRRLPPAQRRAQLLACAIRIFAKRGLGAAGHAQIAREAGVSVPTVFFYFPSRERLVSAVLQEVERFYIAMLNRIRTMDLPAVQLLLLCGSGFADSVDSHPDYARVSAQWSMATQDKVWPRYLRFRDRALRLLESIITQGQRDGSLAPDLDVEAGALVIMGAGHTLAQLKLAGCPAEQMNRVLHVLVRAVVRQPNFEGRALPQGRYDRLPGLTIGAPSKQGAGNAGRLT